MEAFLVFGQGSVGRLGGRIVFLGSCEVNLGVYRALVLVTVAFFSQLSGCQKLGWIGCAI